MKVQIEVSAHHIHLDASDCIKLFGSDRLHKRNNLSQKGEFACTEQVEVVGANNRLAKVRVLGPLRQQSQLEISRTDAIKLGIEAPLSLSGEGNGCEVKIVGTHGSIMKPIAMVAKRHLHLDTATAAKLKLKDKSLVSLKIKGSRSLVFENIVTRIADNYVCAVHLDTDEANAAGISNMAYGELITRL